MMLFFERVSGVGVTGVSNFLCSIVGAYLRFRPGTDLLTGIPTTYPLTGNAMTILL